MARWAETAFASWLTQMSTRVHDIEERLADLEGTHPEAGPTASVIRARVYDAYQRTIRSSPIPTEIREDAELRVIYREALEQAAQPLSRMAAAAYLRCVERAQGPLTVWARVCRTRERELRTRIASADRGSGTRPAREQEQWPDTCPPHNRVPDPQAPPAPRDASLELVVLYDGDEVSEAERSAFLEAVELVVVGHVGAERVPRREVERAQRLVAQRRWHPQGATCGQAPPLPALVALRHPYLILAHVLTECDASGPCRVSVVFDHPSLRTGSTVASLPARLEADAASGWLDAARRLAPPEELQAIGVLRGGYWRRPIPGYRVFGFEDVDPWLRLGPTLDGDVGEALRSCWEGGPLVRFDARWTVDASGGVRHAHVDAEGASDTVLSCVRSVLERTAFPCPRESNEVSVQASFCMRDVR
ncbi:MAG: hypothetical protein AB8I08_32890 [Sandaracinaceae bacterium]